jgi:hypothetical protein
MKLLHISLSLLLLVGCKESEKSVTPSDATVAESAAKSDVSMNLDSRLSNWASGTVKVKAVVFNCLGPGSTPDRGLVEEGIEHPHIVHAASRYLTTSETVELANLVTGEHNPPAEAGCYEPHHGFIFYDANDSIVAYLEVCLMCKKARYLPYKDLAENWDYEGLNKFISKIGLPVFNNIDECEKYFSTQPQVEPGAYGNGGKVR